MNAKITTFNIVSSLTNIVSGLTNVVFCNYYYYYYRVNMYMSGSGFSVRSAYAQQPNIMFIDQHLASNELFLNACGAQTYPVLYDGTGTEAMLRDLLATNEITAVQRVAFAFALTEEGRSNYFFEQTPYYDLTQGQRLISVIQDLAATHVDVLACNTLQHPMWTEFYAKFPATIVVGASSDKTGNLRFGGNWTMENTKENVQSIYFTEAIGQFAELLDSGATNYTVIAMPNGTVWASGYNQYGQFGNVNAIGTQVNTFIQLTDASGAIVDASAVAFGERHMAILRTNGTVWTSGNNTYGQLGINSYTNQSTFQPMMDSSGSIITGIINVACGQYHTAVIKSGSTPSENTAWACGYNGRGQLGNGTTTNQSTLVQMQDSIGNIIGVSKISCGITHTALIKLGSTSSLNTAWACGSGSDGRLGNNLTSGNQTKLVKMMNSAGTFITGVNDISCGSYHTAVIKLGSTTLENTAWACGFNSSRQLGNNTGTSSAVLTVMKETGGNNCTNVTGVACCTSSTYVIKPNNTAWACGDGYMGQLGQQDNNNYGLLSVMKSSSGQFTTASRIICGSNHVIIADMIGSLWSVGRNGNGQLGLNSTTHQNSLVKSTFTYNSRPLGISASTLKLAGYTAGELKAVGFTASELKEAGFTASELKAVEFTASELKAVEFTASELKNAGFTASELKNVEFTASELKNAGFTASELKNAGFTASELKNAGFTASDLKNAGFTASELKNAGFTASELKAVEFTASELKNAGFTASNLKDAGFTVSELKAVEFTASELKDAGYTALQLSTGGYSISSIMSTGLSYADLRVAGLLATVYTDVSAQVLRTAGYTAEELYAANHTVSDMLLAGYSHLDLNVAGVSASTLKALTTPANKMRLAGYTVADLYAAGYTVAQIVAAGYSSSELVLLPN